LTAEVYKTFRKEEVIKPIGKDANALAYFLTETGKGDKAPVQFEIRHEE